MYELLTEIKRIYRVLLMFISLIAASASAEVKPLSAPEPLDATGFRDVLMKIAPNIYISGQPSPEGLAALHAKGVRTVINLRTQQEMDDRNVVPFDEAAKIAELGMTYVHIPLGGPDTPYSPQAIEQLASALTVGEEGGDILLHCTVAWRASHLWAAYLIEKHNYSVTDAINLGKQINLGGFPLAGFLNREVTLVPAQQP